MSLSVGSAGTSGHLPPRDREPRGVPGVRVLGPAALAVADGVRVIGPHGASEIDAYGPLSFWTAN